MHRPNYKLIDLPYDMDCQHCSDTILPTSKPRPAVPTVMVALTIGFIVLALAFWPEISGFLSAYKWAFLMGTFSGGMASIVLLGLCAKPCGDEE